jgi:hypothetical protein
MVRPSNLFTFRRAETGPGPGLCCMSRLARAGATFFLRTRFPAGSHLICTTRAARGESCCRGCAPSSDLMELFSYNCGWGTVTLVVGWKGQIGKAGTRHFSYQAHPPLVRHDPMKCWVEAGQGGWHVGGWVVLFLALPSAASHTNERASLRSSLPAEPP